MKTSKKNTSQNSCIRKTWAWGTSEEPLQLNDLVDFVEDTEIPTLETEWDQVAFTINSIYNVERSARACKKKYIEIIKEDSKEYRDYINTRIPFSLYSEYVLLKELDPSVIPNNEILKTREEIIKLNIKRKELLLKGEL